MVLKNGLSRMRGDHQVRFLGGGGAAMRCCYPTKYTVLIHMAKPYCVSKYGVVR